MNLLLEILIPLLLILSVAGLAQPELFVFWSKRKTRIQGFTGYFAAFLASLTLPSYAQTEALGEGLIMTGIACTALLCISSLISPADFVFWSKRKNRIQASWFYFGLLVAFVTLQSVLYGDETPRHFVWLFTPTALSMIALIGGMSKPEEVVFWDRKGATRLKAALVYVPLTCALFGAMFLMAQTAPPPQIDVARKDITAQYDPATPEGQLLARMDQHEKNRDFYALLREIRQLSSMYEYEAAMSWLNNRFLSDITEPRWAVLYALATYHFKGSQGKRILEDNAFQAQMVGMVMLHMDAVRCVDKDTALSRIQPWTELDADLKKALDSTPNWQKSGLLDAALNLEKSLANRPVATWLCGDNPGNIRSDSEWEAARTQFRNDLEDGKRF